MDFHASDILVAGGGIGGLAAALALSRQGAAVQVIEQAAAFAEVGAGIQIGPNVTRILRDWGLEDGLRQVASFQQALQARDARSGRALGHLPLGERAERVYGAPYACIHRADLHQLLLQAVQAGGVPLALNQRLDDVQQQGAAVQVRTGQGWVLEPALLVLDEPFSALDATLAGHLRSLLLDLKAQGLALLLASHDDAIVAALCDHQLAL